MASGLKIKHESSHTLLRIIAAMVFIALCLLVVFYGVRWYTTGDTGPFSLPIAAAGPQVDESDVSEAQLAKFKPDAAQPRYVSIPVLGVESARVLSVDVDQNNILKLPENIHDAGWYSKSALPGSGTGAVLLDGRSAGPTRAGVFAKVETLQAGDVISLERGDGDILNYEVHDVRTMPVEQATKSGMKEMMYSVDPSIEGLSIVATSGNWVPKLQEYDRRIMVRALLVE